MKALIVFLRILGYAWCVVAFLLILAGTIMVLIRDGFWDMLWLLTPFNIWNWALIAAVGAPGIGMVALAEHLANRLD